MQNTKLHLELYFCREYFNGCNVHCLEVGAPLVRQIAAYIRSNGPIICIAICPIHHCPQLSQTKQIMHLYNELEPGILTYSLQHFDNHKDIQDDGTGIDVIQGQGRFLDHIVWVVVVRLRSRFCMTSFPLDVIIDDGQKRKLYHRQNRS